MYKKKPTILITGSAGFIGHHLVIALAKLDYLVVGIDNINNYYDQELKYSRLKSQGVAKSTIKDATAVQSIIFHNYYFYKIDIADQEFLEKLFDEHTFDYVINLAAQAGVRYSIDNPQTYILNNILGFTNLLEQVRRNDIKHFLYASSSSIYGLSTKVPFNVDNTINFPISIYAASKYSNEFIAHVYSHQYGIASTGMRFFTVYGPWGRPDMAYFSFTKAIIEGTPIQVFNNGELSRDFSYIDDIVQSVLLLIPYPPLTNELTTNENYNETPYRVVNIGRSKPVNLLEFINNLESAIGKKAIKKFVGMQKGDVTTTYAGVNFLQDKFGYTPQTELLTGVLEFVNWYKKFYDVR